MTAVVGAREEEEEVEEEEVLVSFRVFVRITSCRPLPFKKLDAA
jgi:hypothetical protein